MDILFVPFGTITEMPSTGKYSARSAYRKRMLMWQITVSVGIFLNGEYEYFSNSQAAISRHLIPLFLMMRWWLKLQKM